MKWKISKQYEGLLLREYLLQVRGISRRILTAIKFEGGRLLVNNSDVNVRHQLLDSDVVEVIFPPEKRSELLVPEPIPLDIVYEDDDVLVLNKAPHMATIPSSHHLSHTLANGIIHHYNLQQIPYTVHVVTRLDRDTSGLLLIAKHRYSHSILFSEQHEAKVNRHYQAIIAGQLTEKEGVLDYPIDRAPDSIIERLVASTGKRAVTHYQVKEELADISLLDIQLETGRTHQIRVHFSSISHPLIGDSLYGGDTTKLQRQALHCHKLAFNHPLTKKRMEFEIPLANDLELFLQEFKEEVTTKPLE
ncbi:23S rRNA pseudouridine1911/1915/1917 synthase [Gracilibacillus orientalis]|uniref:Pseudouridine synthase n=1 Tax=Gracilibacillus orientalis TaxID=334253 RepID=A0A1I4H4D6_9BACI|nr:RluA family pseudouridine synthase [Gracilibacillus orientalis]SFL36523.1 23S rRNA pseudouridine1911/1915/1917 synthase [Gracilibacillus orientalis]